MAKAKNGASAGGVAAVCRRLAQPIADELGLLLWDVRFVKEGAAWYLRFFIDREDGGVTVDDCADLSRRIDPLLDEADPIAQAYCLEVCSPGIERELRLPEHFERFIGWPIRIRLIRPRDGERELYVQLCGFADGVLSFRNDEESDTETILLKETSGVYLLDGDEEIGGIGDNE